MKRYYHATSLANARKIQLEGFKPGKDGMFGPGIYFAENPMSALAKARSHPVDAVIIVSLNLGRLMTEEKAHPDWNLQIVRSKGFDTVQMTHCNTGVEICVYESSRVTIHSTVNMNIDKLIFEILMGKWGNGHERRIKLERAGHNYNLTQNRVNLYFPIADDVFKGKYGNGSERVRNIENKGLNYFGVQHLVNEKYYNR